MVINNNNNCNNSNNNNSNDNWQKECEKSIRVLTLNLIFMLILNKVDPEKIKCDIGRFRTSFPSISNHENCESDDDSDDRKQEGAADSII